MTDVYLFTVRNALPMMPLSQVKVSYIPVFYRSKHFFSYYYRIFKLILLQYDTSLTFVVLLISVVNLFSNSRHL